MSHWQRGQAKPRAHDTAYRSSPRNSRSTASRLLCRDIRPPWPEPTASVVSAMISTLMRGYCPLAGDSFNRGADEGWLRHPDP